jgi:hypothetical protein
MADAPGVEAATLVTMTVAQQNAIRKEFGLRELTHAAFLRRNRNLGADAATNTVTLSTHRPRERRLSAAFSFGSLTSTKGSPRDPSGLSVFLYVQ